MDNYLINVFYDLISLGSINRVAQKRRISTAYVKSFLSKLEKSIGKDLLFYENGNIVLTVHGKQLFNTAQELFTELEANFRIEAHNCMKRKRETLTIAYPPSFTSSILTSALDEYKSLNPHVNLRMRAQETSVPASLLFLRANAAIRGYDES
jgi:DNA-binding transcriptional LysR family regulator